MKIGSLFSGAGGLDRAVEGIFGATTAFHCEVDPAASLVLARRWPGVPNLGDITAVDWQLVEPVDIMCGGFPCQDVSVGGKQAGLAPGTRSGLWAMFAHVIATVRPRFVVIENVRGLLSARAHRTMESGNSTVGDGTDGPVLRAAGAVLGDLADLGYDAQWVTVSAASVGSCHKRERVFILATPADAARDRRNEGWPESARQQWGPNAAVGGHQDVDLLPTPKSGSNRASRKAMTQQHWSAPSLEQALEIARGELPREFRSWDEVPGRSGLDLLPTPSVADGSGGHLTRSGARSDELLLPGVARAYGRGDLLPTPSAADAERGPDFARAGREGSGGDDLVTLCARATREIGTRWGKYEPAISRWAELTRPAPSPTEPNSKGNPRLAPPFPEWMMGWPAGWVTDLDLTRNEQLRIIGNGVVPQQAFAALNWLLAVAVLPAPESLTNSL